MEECMMMTKLIRLGRREGGREGRKEGLYNRTMMPGEWNE